MRRPFQMRQVEAEQCEVRWLQGWVWGLVPLWLGGRASRLLGCISPNQHYN